MCFAEEEAGVREEAGAESLFFPRHIPRNTAETRDVRLCLSSPLPALSFLGLSGCWEGREEERVGAGCAAGCVGGICGCGRLMVEGEDGWDDPAEGMFTQM